MLLNALYALLMYFHAILFEGFFYASGCGSERVLSIIWVRIGLSRTSCLPCGEFKYK